jgi:hypothetical protein
VDRLLESLLKEEFEDFIRIGSIKRISSKILPYVVTGSATGKEGKEEALRDYKKLLRKNDLPAEEEGEHR